MRRHPLLGTALVLGAVVLAQACGSKNEEPDTMIGSVGGSGGSGGAGFARVSFTHFSRSDGSVGL